MLVVVGAERSRIEAALGGRRLELVLQDPPLGTGDAVRKALPALGKTGGPVLILAGDTPLLTRRDARAARRPPGGEESGPRVSVLPAAGARGVRPGRPGRPRPGSPHRRSPTRPAARERTIGEVNAGVYCFAAEALERALSRIGKNPVGGEYYLTDAVEVLAGARGKVEAVEAEDWREAWGVNTRRDLAAAEEMEHRRGVERALDAGVTVLDPATVRIGPAVRLAPDVILHPFVSLEGATVLEEGCEVFSFTRLVDTQLSAYASIGPHCEMRELHDRSPGARRAVLAPAPEVGDRRGRPRSATSSRPRTRAWERERRRSTSPIWATRTSAPESNIGAGVITCNYDGEKKHPTTIGEGAFVGSDVQLVAPVTVGAGAYVGAGTTVTEDVPDGALAISRSPQVNKPGWASGRKAKKAK